MSGTFLIAVALLQTPAGELYKQHCAACHGPRGEGARGAALAVPRLSRAADDEALYRVIRFGIPNTEMPGVFNTLEESDIRRLVAFVRTLQTSEAVKPAAGDARRGEQLFRKHGCAKCHTVAGSGGALGPDLSDIGSRRGMTHLREAVLEPQAYIPENFGQYRWFTPLPDNILQVRVVTKDGRAITGVRLNEDPFSIQLRDTSDRIHSFWKDELKEFRKDWGKSPMPSYKGILSAAEVDDLVAWLGSLRGRQ